MKHILVIGTASLDILHLNLLQPPQTVYTAGGAGLYTALAANKINVRANIPATYTTLFAPKPPMADMPPELQPAAKLIEWIGPPCDAKDLPRLEIVHYGQGKAELKSASWGAEANMTPTDLPDDLSGYAFVHIAALSSAQRQLEFLQACRRRGAQCISVGTYARLIYNESDTVRRLWSTADLFFMNENECNGLFGSIDSARAGEAHDNTALFVTLGERGARVIHQNQQTSLPAQMTREHDPTGAGDTFCGATLAALTQGATYVDAARIGVALAAETITFSGITALI